MQAQAIGIRKLTKNKNEKELVDVAVSAWPLVCGFWSNTGEGL